MSMDETPEGWLPAALPDICDINPRKPDLAHLEPDAQVTFVPMPAVDAQCGAITRPVLRPLREVRKGFTSFRDDDVIMAKITPCMENGKAAIARGLANGLGFGSTEFHVLRSNGAVLPEYVYQFMRQESFRRAAAAEMTGSVGQKRVPASFLEGTQLPLPPLAEQKRIVAKVGELLARVNAARERLAKVPAILKRFRQSILAAACSGRLTADWRTVNAANIEAANCLLQRINQSRQVSEPNAAPMEPDDEIPRTWASTTLGFLAEPTLRGRAFITSGSRGWASRVSNSGPFFIRSENINTDCLRLDAAVRVSVPAGAEADRTRVAAHDLLLTITGNNVGRTAFVPNDCPPAHVSQHVAIIRTTGLVDVRYLWFWLRSEAHGQAQLRAFFYGYTKPGLNLQQVSSVRVDLPPIDEQREIIRRSTTLLSLADAVEGRFARAALRCDRLGQSILASAFRGELVPTEAELARQDGRDYEPASVLLERLRSERATLGNGAPTARRKPRNAFADKSMAVANSQPATAKNADEPAPAGHAGGAAARTPARALRTGQANGKRRDRELAADTPPPIDQTDRNDVLALIRQVFSDGERRDRATAIRDVAHALGYHRAGARIQEILGTDLLTAVRRGILENERGELRLLCRSADDYTLDHRVDMLLAAMGTGWQTRDEAIAAAARHLGFRRTGPALRAAFKSAINAALRRGLLESGARSSVRKRR